MTLGVLGAAVASDLGFCTSDCGQSRPSPLEGGEDNMGLCGHTGRSTQALLRPLCCRTADAERHTDMEAGTRCGWETARDGGLERG